MAIKASGQITIVDLSDSRQLSVYLTSNLPKTPAINLFLLSLKLLPIHILSVGSTTER